LDRDDDRDDAAVGLPDRRALRADDTGAIAGRAARLHVRLPPRLGGCRNPRLRRLGPGRSPPRRHAGLGSRGPLDRRRHPDRGGKDAPLGSRGHLRDCRDPRRARRLSRRRAARDSRPDGSRRVDDSDEPLTRVERTVHRYGPDRSQLGELFLPRREGPHGVAVVLHGGYWRARYDRSLMADVCTDLAAQGIAAWNLEYRRTGGGGGWPETFADVAAGTDALAELDLPLDLERVVAVGHSAGGHLAFWIAARPTLPRDVPGAAPRIHLRAAVSQ